MAREQSAQRWDPEGYLRNAGFVAALGEPVLALLAPRRGERVLDLGCGEGLLAARMAAAGIDVVAVDASAAMVEAARRRGIAAELMDARELSFDAEFDAVFSNAVLHWVRPPEAAIAGVRRALKPGGRFVGEFGGHGNVAAILVALLAVLSRRAINAAAHRPWYFPTAREYRGRLERASFAVEYIELIPRPVVLPTGIEGWLETFAGPMLALAGGEQKAARAEVVELLRPALCDRDGNWTADYVRLRFCARLPEKR